MPLLKMSSELTSYAIELFHLILRCTIADGAGPVGLQDQLEIIIKLYKYSSKWPELRDELFIQIMKQTHNNPKR
jgi:hypothetical protein